MRKTEEFFVGLDVGSSKISACVGEVGEDDTLTVIGVGNSFVTGVRKGVIGEIEETVSGISEAVEIAERTSGLSINRAAVTINGGHILSTNSRGVIAVGRADQEITKNDVLRAEDASQAIQVPANREILHVIPRLYQIDNQEAVKDPLGMTGVRLEVESHIVMISEKTARDLNRCVAQAGIRMDQLVVSPIAASKAVLTKRQRELGCAVVDIGAETTGLVVYQEDAPLYTKVWPVGAGSVTNDLAIGLRTSVDVAEKVKIKYGNAFHKNVAEKDKIDLSEIDLKAEGNYSKRHVAEITEARYEEIFKLIRDEIRKVSKESLLPAGIILTGGGAKTRDLSLLAKECFKLPVEIGKPHSLKGLTDKVYDPRYSVAIGLMLLTFEEGYSLPSAKAGVGILEKAKKFGKHFLP